MGRGGFSRKPLDAVRLDRNQNQPISTICSKNLGPVADPDARSELREQFLLKAKLRSQVAYVDGGVVIKVISIPNYIKGRYKGNMVC